MPLPTTLSDGVIRAVLFDLGGVIVTSPLHSIAKFERDNRLPKHFLRTVFVQSGMPNGAFARLERGETVLSTFLSQFQAECDSILQTFQPLPTPNPTINVKLLFESMGQLSLVPQMLHAVAALRRKGYKTALVTNNWIDDTAIATVPGNNSLARQAPGSATGGNGVSRLFKLLRPYFDVIVESCQSGMRKPDHNIYLHTCKLLDVQPSQAAFVDDLSHNLKAAAELGMKTFKCVQANETIAQLESAFDIRVLGVGENCASFFQTQPAEKHPYQLLLSTSPATSPPPPPPPYVLPEAKPDWAPAVTSDILPFDPVLDAPPCSPHSVTHGYVTNSRGHRIHYVEAGEGPVVLLCHGWPELWYSWRNQITALSLAGFRVVAFDQRGFGESSAPADTALYSMRHVTEDAVSLLDALHIASATVIGHDWGGAVVWSLAIHYPHRVVAVAGINTPFTPNNPNKNPMVALKESPGRFDYQLYFQDEQAVRELEQDVAKSLKLIIRPSSELEVTGDEAQDKLRKQFALNFANVRKRGGLFAGYPGSGAAIPPSPLLSPADLDVYVAAFQKSGFRGGLNWYRNVEANWEWHKRVAGKKVLQPALMVTAGRDVVLSPQASAHMEAWVPHLSRGHIPASGHWTLLERPRELNRILVTWLKNVVYPNKVPDADVKDGVRGVFASLPSSKL